MQVVRICQGLHKLQLYDESLLGILHIDGRRSSTLVYGAKYRFAIGRRVSGTF